MSVSGFSELKKKIKWSPNLRNLIIPSLVALSAHIWPHMLSILMVFMMRDPQLDYSTSTHGKLLSMYTFPKFISSSIGGLIFTPSRAGLLMILAVSIEWIGQIAFYMAIRHNMTSTMFVFQGIIGIGAGMTIVFQRAVLSLIFPHQSLTAFGTAVLISSVGRTFAKACSAPLANFFGDYLDVVLLVAFLTIISFVSSLIFTIENGSPYEVLASEYLSNINKYSIDTLRSPLLMTEDRALTERDAGIWETPLRSNINSLYSSDRRSIFDLSFAPAKVSLILECQKAESIKAKHGNGKLDSNRTLSFGQGEEATAGKQRKDETFSIDGEFQKRLIRGLSQPILPKQENKITTEPLNHKPAVESLSQAFMNKISDQNFVWPVKKERGNKRMVATNNLTMKRNYSFEPIDVKSTPKENYTKDQIQSIRSKSINEKGEDPMQNEDTLSYRYPPSYSSFNEDEVALYLGSNIVEGNGGNSPKYQNPTSNSPSPARESLRSLKSRGSTPSLRDAAITHDVLEDLESPRTSITHSAKTILTNFTVSFWLLCIIHGLSVGWLHSFMNFSCDILVRTWGITSEHAGFLSALVSGVSIIILPFIGKVFSSTKQGIITCSGATLLGCFVLFYVYYKTMNLFIVGDTNGKLSYEADFITIDCYIHKARLLSASSVDTFYYILDLFMVIINISLEVPRGDVIDASIVVCLLGFVQAICPPVLLSLVSNKQNMRKSQQFIGAAFGIFEMTGAPISTVINLAFGEITRKYNTYSMGIFLIILLNLLCLLLLLLYLLYHIKFIRKQVTIAEKPEENSKRHLEG